MRLTEDACLIAVLQLLTIMFYSYLFYTTWFQNKDELTGKEKAILAFVLFSGFVITSTLAWMFPSFMHSLIF